MFIGGPQLCLGMGFSGMTTRLTEPCAGCNEQDYIRTAWSKGLRERTVVQACMKKCADPYCDIIGGQLANLIGGAVIIEE